MTTMPTGVGRTGVGLELTRTIARGVVVVDADERVAAVDERPLDRPGDDESVVAALAELHRALEADDRPTCIGWYPPGATLQRIDVTGASTSDLNAIRSDLELEYAVSSTMLVAAGVRRWLLAIRWNERAANRLRALAARAGFAGVAVEPAPLSVHRVVGDGVTVVRRDGDRESSWVMLRDGDLPAAATTVPPGRREHPLLVVGAVPVVLRNDMVDAARLVADIDVATRGALDDRASASDIDPELSVVDELYPPYPVHDPRSPHRIAVALGAALGAAGHHGTLRPVGSLIATRPDIDVERRPWTLERVADASGADDVVEPWWRRARSLLGD